MTTEKLEGAPFGYMELCVCGHIRDEHHAGTPQVFGGCDMCLGSTSVHAFEGTGRHGSLHPGLGHWIDRRWVHDQTWQNFKERRFDRLFPSHAGLSTQPLPEPAP